VLHTRIYLPGTAADADAVLASLDEPRRRSLLAAEDEPGSLRFDIRLQGDGETVFFDYV
jgi:protocatechuate 3,4-dioxygenase alpha subunit